MLCNNSSTITLEDEQEISTIKNILLYDPDEKQVAFRHPLFWKYYLVCCYRSNHLANNTSKTALKKIAHIFLFDNTNSIIRESLVLYLSSLDENIDQVLHFITSLINYCLHDELNTAYTNYIVNEVLNSLATNHANNIFEWTKYVNPKSQEFIILSKHIAYSTTYMNDEFAYKVLDEIRRKCKNPVALECYVLINDRFSNGLRQINEGGEKEYIEYIKKNGYVFNLSNPLISIVQWLWVMGRIGPDNMCEEQYLKIAKIIRQQLGLFSNSFDKDIAVQFKEGFLNNAYMIFFNANNDLEEKYYCYSAKSPLSSIIRELIDNQSGLSAKQLDTIRSCIKHFDEAIDFFICNLLFIESSLQDHSRAKKEFGALYKSYNDQISVVELDFYLSALFLSEYIVNPNNRHFYLEQFKQIVNDYETTLFTSPANDRAASRRRFADLMDIEFEDGFNALTNYTYTAASINYVGNNKEIQPVEKYLEEYWKLLKILEETGSYREILRLLQAISQMIVNWPVEGFTALHRFLPAKHQIIRQAIIKVLSQNYLRYPQITKHFLHDAKSELRSTDLLAILGCTDSHIQYRTLEQLQWARIIYFLRMFVDVDIVRKTLSIILNNDTLETTLVKIISLVLDPSNDET